MTDMAMTKCKECGAQISTKAEACPQCGAKPKKTSGCAIVVLGFVLLVAFASIVGQCSGPSTNTGSPSATTSSQTSQPAKEQPKDPAAQLAEQEQAVSEIEQRVKDNAERLKKYYASPSQVKQATTDIIRLALIKGAYADATEKDQKVVGQRAAKLLPRVEQQARELYASSLAEIFVKSGMDVEVTATGKEKKRLRISYALMSQPLVYKFQNEIKIGDQATPLGFTQIVFTNGFDSSLGRTWTVDL